MFTNELLQWAVIVVLGVAGWIALTGFRERMDGTEADIANRMRDDGK